MKILFDHYEPFLFAHGGFQVQIEQTKTALEKLGVEVEFLRWWDASQRGDIIHFFGRVPSRHAELARQKGIKFVATQLLGGLGVRPAWKRSVQKTVIGTAHRLLPGAVLGRIGWNIWKTADAYIAVTSWEAKLMREVFGAAADRVHVVPNGVDEIFFRGGAGTQRTRWLVTTASIVPVKRLVETAKAAAAAKTPYWVTGRPFSESDSYYKEFVDVCRANPEALRYDNLMRSPAELAELYRTARGFVLLSRWESQSLSALEASACECPLFLSDLPWAHATFGESAQYCPLSSVEATAQGLRRFYEKAPQLRPPPKPLRWSEVAAKLKTVYEAVLSSKS